MMGGLPGASHRQQAMASTGPHAAFVTEKKATSMRERVRVTSRAQSTYRRWVGAMALVASATASTALVLGCAVSDSDIHHWEFTERGPENLYKIVVHDKFARQLRVEAALGLVRMKPRQGQHVGLELLIKALKDQKDLTPEARKYLVSELVPKITAQMDQKAPPATPDGKLPEDPSVPYKDAAFALLTEPGLVSDDKLKQDLTAALTQWVQTDFDLRIENRGQQYGLEQIMRQLGTGSVRALPTYMKEDSTKIDRVSALVAELGDDETKKKASEQLVTLAKRIDSPEWLTKTRSLVDERNKREKIEATPAQVDAQLKDFQRQELEPLFGDMKKVGQRPAVEFCLAYAADNKKSTELRKLAAAALENNVDKNNASDVDRIFKIFSDESAPDEVRGIAVARLGELSKDQVLPKLYSLFDAKGWKTRFEASKRILDMLKPMDGKAIADFMRRLPKSVDQKMGKNEPIAYGAIIAGMEPSGGSKPRDELNKYLQSKDIGPRLTAIGSFYGVKKAEAAPLMSMQDDTTPVPKCEEADKCDWNCLVPKAPGSRDLESKKIGTVGEFVKFCILPNLDQS